MAWPALSIALLTTLAAASAAAPAHPDSSTTVVISANEDLGLPADQVARLRVQALAGSGRAAHRLAKYFFFANNDRPSGMYWETIAAEDGYSRGMGGLGFPLMLEKKTSQTSAHASGSTALFALDMNTRGYI